MIAKIIFLILLGAAVWLFYRNISRIARNIHLGKPDDRSDRPAERWNTLFKVAFGQGKMWSRPVPGIMHFLIYAGFILINIEVLEILLDGFFGTHRLFMPALGSFYGITIGFFEMLAVGVLISCVVFLSRRLLVKVPRLKSPDLTGWPYKDALNILVIEMVLMTALLVMNAADRGFQQTYTMPVSRWIAPLFAGMSDASLHILERTAWWAHLIGILAFLNYLPFSKHFHIIMAFPNTYYSNLDPKGKLANIASVTTEVKLMMDPSTPTPEGYEPPTRFGVKDVFDLSWKNLMDAYSCTECGRCTSSCPANITGKLLSPRKVVMNVRDRLEEVGANMDKNGEFQDDGKTLHDYTRAEELWACTTCNACVEACPVNINPMEVIVGMRQYLVLEQSQAPQELNSMFNNLENNGAPWQFAPTERANWAI